MNHSFNQTTSSKVTARQRGASLVEILVSILLVAFGMTAMASMLNFSINANTNSGNRALATMLANELSETIRSNRAEMLLTAPAYIQSANLTDFGSAAERIPADLSTSLCTYPNCTGTTLAQRDVAAFQRLVKSTLPGGDFTTALVNGGQQVDIWLFWAEARGVVNVGTLDQSSDNCPAAVRSMAEANRPRCFYMRVTL